MPPLELQGECRVSFPEKAGKVTLISSYTVETGLLLIVVGPSVFLSSGDGYVRELLELQIWCEGPFGSSTLDVISFDTPQWKWASSRLEGRTSWIFSSVAGALELRRGPQEPSPVS